jgi:hypothetical protein
VWPPHAAISESASERQSTRIAIDGPTPRARGSTELDPSRHDVALSFAARELALLPLPSGEGEATS